MSIEILDKVAEDFNRNRPRRLPVSSIDNILRVANKIDPRSFQYRVQEADVVACKASIAARYSRACCCLERE